jgi:hypothetical protein
MYHGQPRSCALARLGPPVLALHYTPVLLLTTKRLDLTVGVAGVQPQPTEALPYEKTMGGILVINLGHDYVHGPSGLSLIKPVHGSNTVMFG